MTDNEKTVLRVLGGNKFGFINTYASRRLEAQIALHAPRLVAGGYLTYDSKRWSGYRLSAKGKEAAK